MPDDQPARPPRVSTRLHEGRPGTKAQAFASPPIHRGSTMLHVDTADRLHDGSRLYQQSDTYGVYGNATHHALENLVAQVEGGTRCQITSFGLSAATTAMLAYPRPATTASCPTAFMARRGSSSTTC